MDGQVSFHRPGFLRGRSGSLGRRARRGRLAAYRSAVAEYDGADSFAVRYPRERLAILDGDVEQIVKQLGGDLSNQCVDVRAFVEVLLADGETELDPPAWPPAAVNTQLVRRCHELRTVPLDRFTVEDLRLLIGQQIALEVLVPIALEELQANPYAEGDMYPGSLLAAVTRITPLFWERHTDLRQELEHVLQTVIARTTQSDTRVE